MVDRICERDIKLKLSANDLLWKPNFEGEKMKKARALEIRSHTQNFLPSLIVPK